MINVSRITGVYNKWFSRNASDKSTFLGLRQSSVNILPVDNLKDCLHIAGSHVFVLQVVGMLPHINAQQRDKT